MIEDIVHEATYDLPIADVWTAITTQAAIAAWLMDNDFGEPVVGHEFTFRDRPRPFWDGTCPCRVLEADAPRRLALAWNTGQKRPSTVTFDLSEAGGRTTLSFRHSGLRGFMGLMMKQGMDKGWRGMVHRSIPYVVTAMRDGRIPDRDDVTAHRRNG